MLYFRDAIDYDKKFDVLYYNMGDTSNSYGDEVDNNIVILRDIETEEITGVTIVGFARFFIVSNAKKDLLAKYIDPKPIIEFITH